MMLGVANAVKPFKSKDDCWSSVTQKLLANGVARGCPVGHLTHPYMSLFKLKNSLKTFDALTAFYLGKEMPVVLKHPPFSQSCHSLDRDMGRWRNISTMQLYMVVQPYQLHVDLYDPYITCLHMFCLCDIILWTFWYNWYIGISCVWTLCFR